MRRRVGRRHRRRSLPADYLEVRLTSATATTTARLDAAGRSARRGRHRRDAAAPGGRPGAEDDAVLDPRHRDATAPGRLRHRRPRGRARRRPTRRGAGATPRSSPRRSTSCAARPGSSSPRSAASRSTSARASSPGCGSGSPRQGDGPGAAGPDDRRAEPRPARVPAAVHAAAHRRRASTPAAARCSTPSTARCPAACSASPSTRSARPTTSPPSCSPGGEEMLLVGDGAAAVPPRCSPSSSGSRSPSAGLAHPSAASLVQLAHARALREEFGSSRGSCTRSTSASPTPRSTGRPQAGDRWAARLAELDRSTLEVHRHAHAPPPPARPCCASRRRCTRGRGRSGCSCRELALREHAAVLRGPGRRRVVGYAGLMFVVDDAHVTTLAVDPALAPAGHRYPAAAGAGRGRDRTGRHRPHPRGAGEQRRRAGALPALRFRPGRRAQELLPETNEDALVMWAHDVDRPSLRRRLDAIEAAIPGVTVVRGPVPSMTIDPRHRDVVRRDRRRGRRRRARRCCSSVVSQPGRPPRPLRRRRARDRQPGPRRAAHARSWPRRWSRRASRTAERRRGRRPPSGRAWSAPCWSG